MFKRIKQLFKFQKKTNVEVAGLTIVPGMFFINDVVVRDNNGTSEIYVAAGSRKWDRILGTRGNDQNTILGSGQMTRFINQLILVLIGQKLNYMHPID